MNEIWLPVTNWEDYAEVSNLGDTRTLNRIIHHANDNRVRKISSKPLTRQKSRSGYLTVDFWHNNKRKTWLVHHLVLIAFVGMPTGKIGTTKGCYQCNHKDGNKYNNCIDNLEWVVHQENIIHAYETGLRPKIFAGGKQNNKGSSNGMSKLTEIDVGQIRELLSQGVKGIVVAKKFNVSPATITSIKYKSRWK
jgi:hypothetical protein